MPFHYDWQALILVDVGGAMTCKWTESYDIAASKDTFADGGKSYLLPTARPSFSQGLK